MGTVSLVRNQNFIMKIAIALFAFVALVSAACLSGEEGKKEDDLTNCEWYADSSCCDKDMTDAINDGIEAITKECKDIPQGCLDYINLLACYSCSPDASDYENGICADFCEKYTKACDKADCGDDTSDSSTSFDCGDLKDDKCFNAASSLSAPLSLVAVTLLALATYFM